MGNSIKFCDLRDRIRELRSHLLPSTFDATGSYTDPQIDRTRAFRLLAHAEIESYLEDVVFDTANEAFRAWTDHGVTTMPLVAMVAYVERHLGQVPTGFNIERETDLTVRVKKSRDSFNTYTKTRNHGIRERDILRLLLPVGIAVKDIDPTWLATTNSFGSDRGVTAHRSKQVYSPPDPKNEYDIVTQIIEGLSDIDERLLELRST